MASNTPRLDALERNLLINGNFDFWQRGAGPATPGGGFSYLADRYWASQAGSYTAATQERSTDVPTQAQSGFLSTYSHLLTNGTGAAPSAASYIGSGINMEGYDYTNLHGKKGRFQFWCKSSIAGTFAFTVRNGAGTRSYVTTFTVNAVNTWEKKTIDVEFDTAAGYATEVGHALRIMIGLAIGTNFSTSSLNTWQAGNFFGATGQTQWAATTGATFRVSQFMLLPQDMTAGGASLTDVTFQRAGRTTQDELAMCQRYTYKPQNDPASVGGSQATYGSGQAFSTTQALVYIPFPVEMRTTPTLVAGGSSGNFLITTAGGGSVATNANLVLTSNGTHVNGSMITAAAASGLVAGNACHLIKNGQAQSILFDAELS